MDWLHVLVGIQFELMDSAECRTQGENRGGAKRVLRVRQAEPVIQPTRAPMIDLPLGMGARHVAFRSKIAR